MALLDGAATAIGELATTTQAVGNQVSTNARALNALNSQLQTGKNPAFKINPPSSNDPSLYKDDDTALARGSVSHLTDVMGFLKSALEDVHNNASKKVTDSQADPDFTQTGDTKLSTRLSKTLNDIARSVTALTLQKDQGHTVEKTAETLVKLAKSIYNQAGSTIYNEAPMVINSGRLVTNRAALILNESSDNLTKADNEVHRVNKYVLSSNKLFQLVSSDAVIAVGGHCKIIQRDSSKEILIQAGKDLNLKALNGKCLVQTSGDTKIEAGGNAQILGNSGAKLESPATIDITAGATLNMGAAGIVNIAGVIVNLGNSPAAPPGPATAPVQDSIAPQNIDQIEVNKADKKPAILVETRIGLNPPGVLPRRISKDDKKNV